MAQKFKHNETGEIISVARVRYFVEDGKPPMDLGGKYDLSQYTYFDDEPTATYETIKTKKARTDGHGFR